MSRGLAVGPSTPDNAFLGDVCSSQAWTAEDISLASTVRALCRVSDPEFS
jgi:hypothetical protein